MKKVFSLLLVVAMIFSMMTSVMAAEVTEYPEDILVQIEGRQAKVGTGSNQKDGIVFDWNMKMSSFQGTQVLAISYDSSKLTFVNTAGTAQAVTDWSASMAGAALSVNYSYNEETGESSGLPGLEGYSRMIKGKAYAAENRNVLYLSVGTGNSGSKQVTDFAASVERLATFRFALAGSTSYSDLDANTVKFATAEQMNDGFKIDGAVVVSSADGDIGYIITSTAINKTFKTAPTLTYPGSDRTVSTPITGITVTLGTTPAKVPTAAQGNQTVTATAAAAPADATLPTDVAWTVSPANKGVTVAADGKVTVTPSAAAGEYTVTASSASKSVSGNAKFTMTRDPAAVASFNLNKTTTSIKRGANETLSVKDIKDQYGAAASGTATWAVKTDNAGGKITVDTNGKVSVAADATVGNTAVISATINGIEKTCTVTVANLDNSNVTAINAANVKVGTDISASLNGAGNGETITWSVVSGPATLKGSATGATATFTTTGEGTVRIKATQPDSATMKGFTLTKDVTVSGKDPSAKPTVNIAITGGTADGKVVAGEAVTLTANVSGTGVTEANCTYAWTKGGAPAGTGKTLSIAAFDPATDAVKYTCVVTHTQDADHSATVSDPAEITLSEKTKTLVTVTPIASFEAKANATSIAIKDVVTLSETKAAPLLKGTVTVYEKQVTEADPGAACTCGSTDGTHTPECAYKEATPAETKYVVASKLETGKTYVADYAIEAAENDEYKIEAVPAKGVPTEATESTYIKITVKAASSGGGGGSSTTKYTVTYDAGEHGKLDGSATERVESGKNPAKVPSVVADKGYKFVGWTLNGKSVDPTSQKITAATKFVAEYEAADKVTYIQGMDKNHFQPAGNATRGQLATMLARLSKDYDASKTYTGKAPDVENGKWYSNAVNFAINQGIMNGFEDGMFRPTENIRRGEFAAMLARYLGLNTSSKAHFADVTDHWAAGYINALADAGIVDGFEDGTFKAQNLLTRAEAVKMINLAVEMKYDADADYDNSFVDVAQGAWYYEFVMPAANLDVTDYQR